MLTMGVFYRAPQDPETFEKRYVEGHLPLIDKYEKLENRTFHKVSRTVMGQFPYTHVFFGEWASKDDWKADMGSEQARAATEDAQSFATQGFDVVVFEQLA